MTVEFSIVMPCLNEAETLGTCIAKALGAFERLGVEGEVVIADNGSTDGSQEIAQRAGARVVPIAARGYGSALRGGIEAARGRYVIMGDADDSYDFSAIDPFVEKLREGWDLVMGNRFLGGVQPGAMPWKNRWIGNPALSAIGRIFFQIPVGDFHCGLRGFSKQAWEKMNLRTTGMEFASEMVIKSKLGGLRMCEVPTRLHPDGRSPSPHLRPWRDGWRHLRFMLLFSPRWLFLIPGALLMVTGIVASLFLLRGSVVIGGIGFDVHTLLIAAFLVILGYQLVIFGLVSRVYAIHEGFLPDQPLLRSFSWLRLEGGLLVGAACLVAGLAAVVWSVLGWRSVGFGALDVGTTMRQLIPGVTLMTLGVQTFFASFLLSVLSLEKTR